MTIPAKSSSTKPRVFSMNKLHSEGFALAKEYFDLTVPGEPGWENWREEADGILIRTAKITAEDVEIMSKHKVKFVAKMGVGVDAIDQAALKKAGITLTNTPGINATAVAELAIGLMLDVARLVSVSDRRVRKGDILSKLDGWSGQTIRGKTLGIVGGGNIGSRAGKMFNAAFAGPIILYDPFITPEWAQWWRDNIPKDQLRVVDDLNELMSASDIVSVHCPLWAKSKDLIRMEHLKKMKPTAILVNTARGGIVNENDLIDALDQKLIFGAGVDAWESEPPRLEEHRRYCENDRVIMLPHYGGAVGDAQQATCVSMVEHLKEAFDGKPLRDRIV